MEGDVASSGSSGTTSKFRSTPPHGGRHLFERRPAAFRGVSIHAPAWRATGKAAVCYITGAVSIHAPAWRATLVPAFWVGTTVGFRSTPPHGGRRAPARRRHYVHVVSIHAPAWRATSGAPGTSPVIMVSIHAPAWRATRARHTRQRQRYSFDPRPRMEGDAARGWHAAFATVSIHAPAWRATASNVTLSPGE